MTANPEIVFNNMAYGRIKGGISASETVIELYPGDVQLFLPQWASGKVMYLTITDSQNHIEVVKVTGITGQKLTVTRGQDGTVARQWYDGVIINQRMPAALLDACIQKEAHRQVAYNPNGILTAAYRGEKVFQSGPSDCEKRWFKIVEGTKWRLIAGAACPLEYFDDDGYLVSPPPIPSFKLVHLNTFGAGFACNDISIDSYYHICIAGTGNISICELVELTETLNIIDNDTTAVGATHIHAMDTPSVDYCFTTGTGMECRSLDGSGTLTYIDNDIAGGATYKFPCSVAGYTNHIWVSFYNAYCPISFSLGTITRGTGTFSAGYSYDEMWSDGGNVYIGYRESVNAGYIAVLNTPNVSGVLTLRGSATLENAANSYARAFYRAGNFLFVACGNDGIRIYHVNGDDSITYVDKVNIIADGGLSGYSDYLFAVGMSLSRVYAFTIDTDTGALTLVNYESVAGAPNNITSDGNYIYVTNGNNVEILAMREV